MRVLHLNNHASSGSYEDAGGLLQGTDTRLPAGVIGGMAELSRADLACLIQSKQGKVAITLKVLQRE